MMNILFEAIKRIVKSVGFRVKPLLFYKGIFIFYEVELEKLNKSWENPHGVIFKEIDEKDKSLFHKFLAEIEIGDRQFEIAEVDKRLKEGNFLYIAKMNGSIIGYMWAITQSFTSPDFFGTILLNKDEIVVYNAFIIKDFRKKGLFNKLKAYVYYDLNKKGFKRLVEFVWHKNEVSSKAIKSFGSKYVGIVKFIIFLTLSYRYSTLASNRIIFHDGPLLLWKKRYRQIRNRQSSSPDSNRV